MKNTFTTIESEEAKMKNIYGKGGKLVLLLSAIFAIFSVVAFAILRHTSFGSGVDFFEHLPYAIITGTVAISATFLYLFTKDL